ncbi:unnamed protein product [Caretta caretta]
MRKITCRLTMTPLTLPIILLKTSKYQKSLTCHLQFQKSFFIRDTGLKKTRVLPIIGGSDIAYSQENSPTGDVVFQERSSSPIFQPLLSVLILPITVQVNDCRVLGS